MANCGLSSKVGLFLVGVGAGALIAVLCAPNSGKQTRRLIAKKAEEGKDYVADKSRELIEEVGDRLAEKFEAGKSAAKSAFQRP
jgi:gas vesicle protein